MSKPIEEKISSLIDDELAPADRDQLIKQLKQNSAHQDMLGRYCLIQEAMKKNLHSNPKHDLFSRVSSALESEPVLFAPAQETPPNPDPQIDQIEATPQKVGVVSGWLSKPSYGWAAAAAIAMVAVVNSVNLSGTQEPNLGAMDIVSKQGTQQLVVPVMSQQSSPVLVTNTPRPTVQVPHIMPSDDQWERIGENKGIPWGVYLKEHSETASQTGVQPSVAPMARIVSFEGDGQKQ
jgi:negative regulator of sigma E activity